ncbi:hypothetical protein [Anaerorhabdus furcosa]|uniref:Uncharacterized protein n=1 Tax=Anaerorhabdus furcosa TaxID=118967 RepID=A0A1T4Q5T1_9FIRM|nr:hypothetical protein [Anaerorhabdus furcosa]SJZ99125.1 hypothetical protein SAMN02745191_2334 [Anaerorhabdus furcosa]
MQSKKFKSMLLVLILFSIFNTYFITVAFNDVYFGPTKLYFSEIQGGLWFYLICILLFVTFIVSIILWQMRKKDLYEFKDSVIQYKWWVILIYMGLILFLVIDYSLAIYVVPLTLIVLNPWAILILLCFLI